MRGVSLFGHCRDQHFKEYAVQQTEAFGLQQGFQIERVEPGQVQEKNRCLYAVFRHPH